MNRPEELDPHIKEVLNDEEESDSIVTGWVLLYAKSRFNESGDLSYKHGYMIGPDCDIARAIGLAHLGTIYMDKDLGGERN